LLPPLAAPAHAPTCQRCPAAGRSRRSYLPHSPHPAHQAHPTYPILRRLTNHVLIFRGSPRFAVDASSATASALLCLSSCSFSRSPLIASTTSALRSPPSPRSPRRPTT